MPSTLLPLPPSSRYELRLPPWAPIQELAGPEGPCHATAEHLCRGRLWACRHPRPESSKCGRLGCAPHFAIPARANLSSNHSTARKEGTVCSCLTTQTPCQLTAFLAGSLKTSERATPLTHLQCEGQADGGPPSVVQGKQWAERKSKSRLACYLQYPHPL